MSITVAKYCLVAGLLFVSGCSIDKTQVSNELTVALDAAATLEGEYAARPTADPKVTAEVGRLLAVAQAAVASWQASTSASDQAAANAAISALVAYLATAQSAPLPPQAAPLQK